MPTLNLEGYPNPKQEEFFMATNRHIAYGGARGGGKSWSMRRKFVLLALNYTGLRLLLLRRTLPELRENHVLPLLAELTGIARYKETEKSFVFPNGSRIKLGYCDSDKDIYQYQGQEYDVIGLEEATHFTESMRDFLTTCNRSTRTDFSPRMYYTSNPGNVGHQWFKRLFIDREYRGSEKVEDFLFIQAKVYDNTVLMQTNPEYVQSLENLPEDMRKAHLYGDWDAFAGQYFTEFDRSEHIIAPIDIPKSWNRFLTIDYGLDMLAAYWVAIDTQYNAYVYRELYESDLIISDAAEKIKEMTPKSEKIKIMYAPPDLWNRRQDTGRNAIDIFAEHGLYFVKAKNDRVLGWYNLKEWLKVYQSKDEQTGEPRKHTRLKIFSTCKNLIRCIPQAQHDEKNPNDVANTPHEITHSLDSIRYFLADRPIKSERPIIEDDEDEDDKIEVNTFLC